MTFIKFFLLYILTLPVFLLDYVWLGIVSKDFYSRHIGHLFANSLNWYAVAAFYLQYMIGILVFVVVPALNNNSPWKALLLGSLLGFVAYSTYDLVNYATLKDWPFIVVVLDVLWGIFITGVTSFISFWIGKMLGL